MLQIRRVLNDYDLKEQKYLFTHKHAKILLDLDQVRLSKVRREPRELKLQ